PWSALAQEALALRGVVQEQVPDRGRVDTGYALRRSRQVIVEVPDDDRSLVEQQRLDLPGDAPLAGQIDGADVLREQLGVLGVAEMGGVPRAGARLRVDRLERRAQEYVRYAAAPVVDQAHRGVQPGRAAELERAVVLGLVLHLQVDLHADGRGGLRHDLGVVG